MAIILLNYRGAADTLSCLASLETLSGNHTKIIVVDNASNDGSVEQIRQAHPNFHLIASDTNLGFSGGNNLAIDEVLRSEQFDYIWLLNNDTTVESDTLKELLAMAHRHPDTLIGSLIRYPDGRFQRVGNRFVKNRGSIKAYAEDRLEDGQVVEALTGCSMLIPTKVFQTIGLLDEQYFLYFEDNDFCFRAREAGFESRVALKSIVFHQEGASTGKNRPLVTYYYQRNRLLFARRFVSLLNRLTLELYTHWRLVRSTIKATLKNNADIKAHDRAFSLAVKDYQQGVFGPCPHEI